MRINQGKIMRKTRRARTPFLIACALLLSACSTTRLPEASLPQQAVSAAPEIKYDARTGDNYTDIDVLIYNVAGLPWPIRKNRTHAMSLIGDALLKARHDGEEPDIILIQEGFRKGTRRLLENSGYPNWVRGPATKDRAPKFSSRATPQFIEGRRFFKGEKIAKIMDSGLYVLSNFPIRKKVTAPFYSGECAGFDCGSNKGVLWAEIEVPGMPGYLQMFTTHMQSREAAGVSFERSLTAYNLQFDAMDEFVETVWTEHQPMIFGGDFNAKNAKNRLDYMSDTNVRRPSKRTELVKLTQHYCVTNPHICKAELTSNGEAPWLDTQDWQGFSSGTRVKVTPIMILDIENLIVEEAPEIKGKRTLSDHGAVWVRYRLSWSVQ
jgi:endonuclease/exonuclease/phosphatase family metal-dependent hydrolase